MSRMDADLFRGFRKSKGMTQRDLARVLGISRRTVQNIELAAYGPSQNTQRLFAELRARHAQESKHGRI